MRKTTIIIADDHPLFRSGVRTELENTSRFNIIDETGDGEEALHLISNSNPDIAILDFQMPGLNGLEIARMLNKINNRTQIILLTMYSDKNVFFNALDAGVKGYVLKDDAIMDIVKAVDTVASGGHFVSDNLTDLLIEKAKNNADDNEIKALINELTSTEKKILKLVANLKSNEEISSILYISKRTIENYKVSISNKLQLKSSRWLLKFALQNKDHIEQLC